MEIPLKAYLLRYLLSKKPLQKSRAQLVIHSNFECGFICAETIAYEDYIQYQGEQGAKAAAKLWLESRNYIVHDGDVFHFRFKV